MLTLVALTSTTYEVRTFRLNFKEFQSSRLKISLIRNPRPTFLYFPQRPTTTPGEHAGDAPTRKVPQIFAKLVKNGARAGAKFSAEIAKSKQRRLLLGEHLGKLQPPNRHKFLTRPRKLAPQLAPIFWRQS